MKLIDPKATVDVTDGENTITIKAKMSLTVYNNAMALWMKLSKSTFSGMSHESALVVANIVKWSGPAFVNDDGKQVLCTENNKLNMLPPVSDSPFLKEVLEKINELNKVEIDENVEIDEDNPDPN